MLTGMKITMMMMDILIMENMKTTIPSTGKDLRFYPTGDKNQRSTGPHGPTPAGTMSGLNGTRQHSMRRAKTPPKHLMAIGHRMLAARKNARLKKTLN